MKLYEIEKELELSKSVGLTDEVHALVKRENAKFRKKTGKKISNAKIVCNLIIEKYGNT